MENSGQLKEGIFCEKGPGRGLHDAGAKLTTEVPLQVIRLNPRPGNFLVFDCLPLSFLFWFERVCSLW